MSVAVLRSHMSATYLYIVGWDEVVHCVECCGAHVEGCGALLGQPTCHTISEMGLTVL